MKHWQLLALVLGMSVSSSAASAQAAPACSPDSLAQVELKAWVVKWTMAPDSDSLNSATRIGLHLPKVTDPSEVKLITATTTCKRLRTALAATLDGTVLPAKLSVVALQVDTVYLALDEAQRAGEFVVVGVYGSKFQELTRFFH